MAASLWVGEVHHNWEGSRIKPEAQVRGAQLQLASRKGVQVLRTYRSHLAEAPSSSKRGNGGLQEQKILPKARLPDETQDFQLNLNFI